jgi:apolipoprotein N-acyltransferase
LPLALVPWIVALFFERKRWIGLLSGAVFGLAFWCLSVSWVSFVVVNFGEQPSWMGPACVVLLALILSQWPALVGWTVVAAFPTGSRWRLISFPILWTAAEHARGVVYNGFPWNLTANALYRHPLWLQTASIWGAYGVGLVVAAVWTLFAAVLLAPDTGSRLRVSSALVVLLLCAGLFGLEADRPGAPLGPALRIDAVQPNVAQLERLNPEEAAESYGAVISWIRRAASRHPALIVVPESAFYGLTWQRSEILRRDLTVAASDCRCAILFNDIDEMPDGRYFNAARLLTPDGLLAGTYRKVHLVPFGEYVPLPRLFFFMKAVTRAVGAFSAAKSPVLLEQAGVKIGPAICYEMTYPTLAREEARSGATLLASISNDSWYGRAGAQEQHFSAAVLRAIETRRPFVRAAVTGVSGIVDERGRIVAEVPAGEPGIAEASIVPGTARTIWSRWGVGVPVAADLAAGLMVVLGLGVWRRNR